jgi:hypothetical protein
VDNCEEVTKRYRNTPQVYPPSIYDFSSFFEKPLLFPSFQSQVNFAILTARSAPAVLLAFEGTINLVTQNKLQSRRSKSNLSIPDQGKENKMLTNSNISNLRHIFLFVIFMVGTFLIVGCQSKPEEAESEEIVSDEIVSEEVFPEEVVIKFIDSINSKDADTANTLLSDDINFNFGEQDTLNGKDDVQSWLLEMFGQNLRMVVMEAGVEDGVVVLQTSATWTKLQNWHIEELTGKTEATLENGKISAFDFKLDDESLVMLPVPVSSIGDLVGVWQRAKPHPAIGDIFIQFHNDGMYRQSTNTAERLDTTPMVEGYYEFDSGKIIRSNETQLVANYLWDCEDSTTGEYNVSRLANGNIILEVVKDECRGREDTFASEYQFVQ